MFRYCEKSADSPSITYFDLDRRSIESLSIEKVVDNKDSLAIDHLDQQGFCDFAKMNLFAGLDDRGAIIFVSGLWREQSRKKFFDH